MQDASQDTARLPPPTSWFIAIFNLGFIHPAWCEVAWVYRIHVGLPVQWVLAHVFLLDASHMIVLWCNLEPVCQNPFGVRLNFQGTQKITIRNCCLFRGFHPGLQTCFAPLPQMAINQIAPPMPTPKIRPSGGGGLEPCASRSLQRLASRTTQRAPRRRTSEAFPGFRPCRASPQRGSRMTERGNL